MVENIFDFLNANIFLVLIACSLFIVIYYYIKYIIVMIKLTKKLEELEEEYSIEQKRLFKRYDAGELEPEDFLEKEIWLGQLYLTMMDDIKLFYIKPTEKGREKVR